MKCFVIGTMDTRCIGTLSASSVVFPLGFAVDVEGEEHENDNLAGLNEW